MDNKTIRENYEAEGGPKIERKQKDSGIGSAEFILLFASVFVAVAALVMIVLQVMK